MPNADNSNTVTDLADLGALSQGVGAEGAAPEAAPEAPPVRTGPFSYYPS